MTTDAAHLAYLTAVLGAFADADYHDGGLLWHVKDGRVHFFATCSDTFHWASADAEEITEADVPLLRQCLADLKTIKAEYELPTLFSARKRGMRPMSVYIDQYRREVLPASARTFQGIVALFEACGPERTKASEG